MELNVWVLGGLIGAWAFLFTNVFVRSKEVFGFVGEAINYAIWGKYTIPSVSTLKWWRLWLYKWTYCAVCQAGFASLWISFRYEDPTQTFIILGAVAMITAKLLERYDR